MLNPAITQILSCINEHIHEPLSLKTAEIDSGEYFISSRSLFKNS